MLEYRIPAASVASAAIVVVCFIIALLLLSSLAASRSRALGLAGVTMVFAGTGLQALNGSMAGAYGTDTTVYAVVSVLVAGLTAGGVVLVALGLIRSPRAHGDR